VVAGNVPVRGGHRTTWAVLVAASAMVVAGCGSVSSSTSGTPGVTGSPGASAPTPSVVSPADTARQQATAAYLGMWQDMSTAGQCVHRPVNGRARAVLELWREVDGTPIMVGCRVEQTGVDTELGTGPGDAPVGASCRISSR
jgi:hypothetical protein